MTLLYPNPCYNEVCYNGIALYFNFCIGHPFLRTNSFLASSDFCRLLITFANNLDPDQDRQNVGPDLDLKYLTL